MRFSCKPEQIQESQLADYNKLNILLDESIRCMIQLYNIQIDQKTQILIKGQKMKPKITKLIKLLSLFVIFVVVIKGQSSVDSSKYVWVDYSQVNLINETVIQSKDVFYRVNIPCKTSIQACIYNYLLIPQGWKVETNGSLLVPQKQISQNRVYLIEVELRDSTGQKLNGRFILQINNKRLFTSDAADYMLRNKGRLSEQEIRKYKSYYDQSPLISGVPQNLPNIQQAQRIISGPDNFKIRSLVDQIIKSKFPSCMSGKNYMIKIYQILNKYALSRANAKQLQQQKQILLKNKLADLKYKMFEFTNKTNIDLQKSPIQRRIEIVTKQQASIDEQLQYFYSRSDEAMSKYKQQQIMPVDLQMAMSQTDQNLNLNRLKYYSSQILQWINSAVNNRQVYFQAVSDLNFRVHSINVKDGQQADIKLIQDQYNSIRKQIFNEQVKYLLQNENAKNQRRLPQLVERKRVKLNQNFKLNRAIPLLKNKQTLLEQKNKFSNQNTEIQDILTQLKKIKIKTEEKIGICQ